MPPAVKQRSEPEIRDVKKKRKGWYTGLNWTLTFYLLDSELELSVLSMDSPTSGDFTSKASKAGMTFSLSWPDFFFKLIKTHSSMEKVIMKYCKNVFCLIIVFFFCIFLSNVRSTGGESSPAARERRTLNKLLCVMGEERHHHALEERSQHQAAGAILPQTD